MHYSKVELLYKIYPSPDSPPGVLHGRPMKDSGGVRHNNELIQPQQILEFSNAIYKSEKFSVRTVKITFVISTFSPFNA